MIEDQTNIPAPKKDGEIPPILMSAEEGFIYFLARNGWVSYLLTEMTKSINRNEILNEGPMKYIKMIDEVMVEERDWLANHSETLIEKMTAVLAGENKEVLDKENIELASIKPDSEDIQELAADLTKLADHRRELGELLAERLPVWQEYALKTSEEANHEFMEAISRDIEGLDKEPLQGLFGNIPTKVSEAGVAEEAGGIQANEGESMPDSDSEPVFQFVNLHLDDFETWKKKNVMYSPD